MIIRGFLFLFNLDFRHQLTSNGLLNWNLGVLLHHHLNNWQVAHVCRWLQSCHQIFISNLNISFLLNYNIFDNVFMAVNWLWLLKYLLYHLFQDISTLPMNWPHQLFCIRKYLQYWRLQCNAMIRETSGCQQMSQRWYFNYLRKCQNSETNYGLWRIFLPCATTHFSELSFLLVYNIRFNMFQSTLTKNEVKFQYWTLCIQG